MRGYLTTIIKLSNNLTQNLTFIRTISKSSIPTLVQIEKPKKLNVLDHPQIKEFRNDFEQILNENEKYKQIYDAILSKADRKQDKKLKFKLSYIIYLIRKLTNTFNKTYSNDSAKLKFFTETIVNKFEHTEQEEDLEIEFELLGFDSFDFEDYEVTGIGEKIFGSDDNYHKFLVQDYNMLTKREREELLDDLLSDFDLKMKHKYLSRIEFDYLVLTKGEKVSKLNLDYEENVMESIEKEISVKLDELRPDFVSIDEHVNELRIIIAKEWLFNYEDKCLQSIYGSSSDQTVNQNVYYIDYDKKNDDP